MIEAETQQDFAIIIVVLVRFLSRIPKLNFLQFDKTFVYVFKTFQYVCDDRHLIVHAYQIEQSNSEFLSSRMK